MSKFFTDYLCYIIINLKKQLLLKNSLFNSIFFRKKVCHKKLKILGNDRLGEIILILALTFSEKATIEKYILWVNLNLKNLQKI